MERERASGILVHPTSIPAPHGVGDLGAGAYRFLDWLAAAGQRRWQVMPLVPTGLGDSPYASPSAFAGNPLLISLNRLVDDGLLQLTSIAGHEGFDPRRADFAHAAGFKMPLLRKAFDAFRRGAAAHLRSEYESFRANEESWLRDHALFMAAKDHFGGSAWLDWDDGIKHREAAALAAFAETHADAIRFHTFVQFLFRRQWQQLRDHARTLGIRVIGDIPIFVALDSADVWANREVFRLDEGGRPKVVAGVPPDYFSETGQLWGNPLYDWDALEETGYRWWIERFRNALELVDIIRIDHFRGMAAAWTIPAGAKTAREGRWERGPGRSLFDAVEETFGALPIIVEDLGLITKDVVDLRDELGLPGMAVLQFAFGGDPFNEYLPHNHVQNLVVYSGTHDNATTIGWFAAAPEMVKSHVKTYLGHPGHDIAWDLMRLALASCADTAIVPVQDVMRLGDEARMNTPGTLAGNWSWRFEDGQLTSELASGLKLLTETYGRGADRKKRGRDPYDYTAPGTSHPLH